MNHRSRFTSRAALMGTVLLALSVGLPTPTEALQVDEGLRDWLWFYDAAREGDLPRLRSSYARLTLSADELGQALISALGLGGVHLDVVRFLIDAGANVNVEWEWVGTPLSSVVDHVWYSGRSDEEYRVANEAIRLLLLAGADPNVGEKVGQRLISLAGTPGADLEPTSGGGYTRRPSIHGAAATTALRALLLAGASANVADSTGRTPLHAAANTFGTGENAGLLLGAGARVDARDQAGRTPLMLAATWDVDVLRTLIAAGADLELKDNSGWTPLGHAIWRGSDEVVRTLLDAGAAPDTRIGDEGWTPLMLVASNGDAAVARLLVEAGAATDAQRTSNGQTALMRAAAEGHRDVVDVLLEAGASVNLTGNDGVTGLMIAAHQAHESVVASLLEAGADVTLVSGGGTAMDVAYPESRIRQILSGEAAPLPDAVLESYAGAYRVPPSFQITVTAENGTLFYKVPQREKGRLIAQSDDRFVFDGLTARVTFLKDGAGMVTALNIQDGANEFRAEREPSG